MSAPAHSVKVFVPFTVARPRVAIAVEYLFDWATAVVAAFGRRRTAARFAQQVLQESAAARREAAAWMRHDPRVAAELMAAADRHEAMHL